MATTTTTVQHYWMDRGIFIEPACGTSKFEDTPDLRRTSEHVTCEDCKETAESEEAYDGPMYSEDRF